MSESLQIKIRKKTEESKRRVQDVVNVVASSLLLMEDPSVRLLHTT